MPANAGVKISVAAKAAGISQKALTRGLDRKLIEIPVSDPGKGHPRLLYIDGIYRIAIGHALTKLFITPAEAMKLATKFFEPQRGRSVGRLFATGKTIMLVTPESTGSIINLQADEDISAYLQDATSWLILAGSLPP
jgi:hypothetical protein